MAYENLKAYLNKKGLKLKAEGNTAKAEAIKTEYKEKEKGKALTTTERLDRIEKMLGIQ
jgi:hypothetical protein